MSREVTEYRYTCNGCGAETHAEGDSYPANWKPADPEDCDDGGEDYCPTCQAQGHP
jgi:hypothetical protein